MGMFGNRARLPEAPPMPGIIGGFGGGTFDLDGNQVTPVQRGDVGPMGGAAILQNVLGLPNPRPMQPADFGPQAGSMATSTNTATLAGPSNPGLGEILMRAARPTERKLTDAVPQFGLDDTPSPDPTKLDASPGLAGLNGFRANKVRPHFFDKDGIGSKVLRGLGEFALQWSASSGDQSALMTLRNRFEQQNNQRRLQQEEVTWNRHRQQQQDDWRAQYDYKAAHPELAAPTEFERLAGAAYGVGTPEYLKAVRGYVTNRQDPSHVVQTANGPMMVGGTFGYPGQSQGLTPTKPVGKLTPLGGQGAPGSPFNAVVAQESGGRVGVQGPVTKYGRAQGLAQLLPATAQEQAVKHGIPWRPDLMTATTPEAAQYQRGLGELYFNQGLQATGNLRDAFRYYHGGPSRPMWGPKTNAYADAVMARMGT